VQFHPDASGQMEQYRFTPWSNPLNCYKVSFRSLSQGDFMISLLKGIKQSFWKIAPSGGFSI
jgi:hypothetical protein